MKSKFIKFLAIFLAIVMASSIQFTAFSAANFDDDDDIYNEYSKEAMKTPTGNGIVFPTSVYSNINVNNVAIQDNPLPTTSTTYPSVFPKELLYLPQKSDAEIQAIISALLPVMTFEEKVRILGLSDSDPDQRSGVGWMLGVPRLGIPEIRFNDGPAGTSTNAGNYRETTNPPSEESQAATWDPYLAYKVGSIYGTEHRSIGLGYQLGTQFDTIRMPIWSRAKDAFGEDYYLNAKFSAEATKGVQENGGLAMGKHIGAYATDGDTLLWNVVDEQTLHTAYLFPFEYAAKNAQLSSIMGTYNRLNGYYTSSNYYMQVETLRNMWGWKGAMVPDWGANREFSMMLGTDISQDGYNNLRTNILRAIGYGNLTWKRVDDAVKHSLYAYGVGGFLNLVEIDADTGLAKEDKSRTRIQFADTYAADRAAGMSEANNDIALEVAEKGIVLLKNDNGALPVEHGTIALVGTGAEKLYGGTGGERSYGVQQYMRNPKDVFIENLGEDTVTSAISIRPYGVTVPESAFFQDAAGTVPGLLRNDGAVDAKIEFLYEEGQMKGGNAFTSNHTWTGYIEIPADIDSFVAQSQGGTLSYNIQARTNAGGNYTISGNRGGGVEWDNYTPDGLNFAANNVSTRDIAPGIYPITVTQTKTANDSYRDNGVRLAWITRGQKEQDLQDARDAAAENDTTIMFIQQGRTGHSGVNVTDYNMLKIPDGTYSSSANGNVNYLSSIKELAGIAHENGHKFVLVVFSMTAFSFDGDWLDDVDALVAPFYAGQSYATALFEILTGRVNPSGKTTVTFPKTMYDTLMTYDEAVKVDRVGAQTQNGERTANYTEGLNFGYRWYDTEEAQNAGCGYQYPFGYGLSYTTFDYSNLQTEYNPRTNELNVSFDLQNTGDRAGSEIAQVYVGPANLPDDKGYVQQAAKQLAAFQRVDDIAPGQTVRVNLTIEERMLSYWDKGIPDNKLLKARDGSYGKWVFANGARDIMVGSSSADLRLAASVDMYPQTKASIAAPAALDISDSKELTYTVSISNGLGVNMFDVDASFDPAKLSYVDYSIELPASFSAAALATEYKITSGKFFVSIAMLGQGLALPSNDPTPLLKIKFRVKDGVDYGDAITGALISVGTYSPGANQSHLYEADLDPAAVTTVILSPKMYDADGDGVLTMKDVSFIIFKYYLAALGDPNWDEAKRFDTNGDNFIDLSDIMYIISLL